MTYAQGYIYCTRCGAPKEYESQPCPHCGPITHPIRANVEVLPKEETVDNPNVEITAFVLSIIIAILALIDLYTVIKGMDLATLIISTILVILCSIEMYLNGILKRYWLMGLQFLNIFIYIFFAVTKILTLFLR